MEVTLLTVGAELARGEALSRALAPLGCRTQTGTVETALAEWQDGPPPQIVVLGCDVCQDDAARIKQHFKLTERLNHVGLLMLTREGLAALPLEGLRIEPDLYLKAPASTKALVNAVERLRSMLQQRAEAGMRSLLELAIPSDIVLLRQVEEMLQIVLKGAELGPKDIWAVLQSTREMGLNAIEWGNAGVKERCVRFIFSLDRERFSATIRDEGQGFDPRNLPHAADPRNPLGHIALRETSGIRMGGYGILICRELMDEFRYNDAGNEVTLVKRLGRGSMDDGASDDCDRNA